MKLICFTLSFFILSFQVFANIDIGFGSSSFTAGRFTPALAMGVDINNWGVDFRGVGVQTKVYSQNATTLAFFKNYHIESFGSGKLIFSGGAGGSYIHRTYRASLTDDLQINTENVFGPYLSIKYKILFFYFGADTVLGLSPNNFFNNIVLNFQDMSHLTIGMSL